jgi:hypothetical protein
MRQPPYPIEQLAKAARDPKKLTEDEIRLIVTCFSEYRRASNDFESRLYSVTHERDRLKAENEFLIKLFNLKSEEQCPTEKC